MHSGHLVLGLGGFLLLHAAFSTVHYKDIVEQRYGDVLTPIPYDIYVESVVAVGIVVLGVLMLAGSFAPIYSAGDNPINSFHRLFAPRIDFLAIGQKDKHNMSSSSSSSTTTTLPPADVDSDVSQ